MTGPTWTSYGGIFDSGLGTFNAFRDDTATMASFQPYKRSFICFYLILWSIQQSQQLRACRSSFTSSTSFDSSPLIVICRFSIFPSSVDSTLYNLIARRRQSRANSTFYRSNASFCLTSQCLLPSLDTLFNTSLTDSTFSHGSLSCVGYSFIHGLYRNSYMLIRFCWSLSRQASSRSESDSAILGEGGRRTFSFVTLLMNTTYPWSMGNGSFPKTNWKRMTPIDQMSHFLSYGLPCNISGAIVMGVPQYVLIITSSFPASRANPKSANLMVKSFLSKTLASFISLCAIPFACKWRTASAMHPMIFRTLSGGSKLSMFSLRYFQRSPLSQNSNTRQQLLVVYSVSCNLTM